MSNPTALAQKNIPQKDLTLNGKVKLEIYNSFKVTEGKMKWESTDSIHYNEAGNYFHESSYNHDSTENYKLIYVFDSTGQYLIHYCSYNHLNKKDEETFTEYDSLGYEVKTTTILFSEYDDDNDSAIFYSDTTIYYCSYNSNHRIVEEKSIYQYEEKPSSAHFTNTDLYIYDPKGRMVKRKSFDNDGIQTDSVSYSYDSINNSKKTDYSNNKWYQVEFYDSLGRRIAINTYFKPFKIHDSTFYTYNSFGNCIKESEYTEEGKLSRSVEYEFGIINSKINVLKIRREREFNSKGIVLKTSETKYEGFDKQGNALKLLFLTDGVMTSYFEKQIFYFKCLK